jgi:hypothetical protein
MFAPATHLPCPRCQRDMETGWIEPTRSWFAFTLVWRGEAGPTVTFPLGQNAPIGARVQPDRLRARRCPSCRLLVAQY